MAYGCQCCVVVVDPWSLALIQTLDEHRAPVTQLLWCPIRDPVLRVPQQCGCFRVCLAYLGHTSPCRGSASWEDKAEEYPLILASGDSSGSVIIWNVLKAEIRTTFGTLTHMSKQSSG